MRANLSPNLTSLPTVHGETFFRHGSIEGTSYDDYALQFAIGDR